LIIRSESHFGLFIRILKTSDYTGDSQSVKSLAEALASLGYVEVKEVKESEQWSRSGFSKES
jgi:hypothetical protein